MNDNQEPQSRRTGRSPAHGHSANGGSPTYRCWSAMKRRCNNPSTVSYPIYGAAGIQVCERWNDFSAFLADMGERPTEAHSLDRIDNAKGYQPGNVRWATQREQQRNRTNIRGVVRSDGLAFGSATEAAESTGANPRCIHHCCTGGQRRHRGYGWSYANDNAAADEAAA